MSRPVSKVAPHWWECIDAWKQSTPDSPSSLCGPIGPTEQLPSDEKIVGKP